METKYFRNFFLRLFVVRPMLLKYGSKHSLLRGCRWQKNIESRYAGRSLHTQQFPLKFKMIVYYIQVLVSRVLYFCVLYISELIAARHSLS